MNESQYIPTVLVVDDHEVNRAVIRAVLKDRPYRIIEATNGEEAVEEAFRETPDLILMDLMMPGMDGLEATERIKADTATGRTPVLMLTALGETSDRIRAFQAGVTGFLTKPVDQLELLAQVGSYLNLSLINRKYILSTVSAVTGLPNHTAFLEDLEEGVLAPEPKLVVIKIDELVTISRFYGEEKADFIEKQFSEAIAESCPPVFGGAAKVYHLRRGLFGVVVSDPEEGFDRRRAQDAAREILGVLTAYEPVVDDVQYHSDFTVVVALNSSNLLPQAEMALGEAAQRRANLVFAEDVAERSYRMIEHNMGWLRRIKNAVFEDRVSAHFQPIVELSSGEVVRYEALVRLFENGTAHTPGEWLHVAKKSKYYQDITRVVFRKAVEAFAGRAEGVAVNVSVLDIENAETRAFIFGLLAEYPEVAKRLTVEIVEEEGLEHYEPVKQFIERLKEYGVEIAIDDFGSGYSNFKRIVDLNVDYLKIDGSLVRDVCGDPTVAHLVSIIQSFASFSGVRTVAEFVHDQPTRALLRELGVEFGQGFEIGKPEALG